MTNNHLSYALKRQHPASIFVSFFHMLKNVFIPLIFSFLLGSGKEPIGFFRYEYIWIGLLAFIFIHGFVQWFTFRYRLIEGELYVQHGLFVKKKRYIREERIHSIDITANILQRPFGLVQLNIETAGGGIEPDVQLLAISLQEAKRIRGQLLKNKTSKKVDVQTNWTLKRHRLVIAALTSSGVALALSAVVAVFSQIEQFIPNTVYERLFGFLANSSILFIGLIMIIIIFISYLLSFIGTVLKYGNFSITKKENELVITRGMLETMQLTIHTERITAVRIVQNVFRQPFGYVAVYVESAGGGSSDEQLSTILFPLVKKSELPSLFMHIIPEYAFSISFIPLPKRAWRRAWIRYSFFPFVITLIGGLCLSPYFHYGWIVVFVCTICSYLYYRDGGIGYNEQFIWLRTRFFRIVTVIAPRKKLQAVETSASYFQRKKQLTTFQFSVQTSAAGKTFSIRDIETKNSASLMRF